MSSSSEEIRGLTSLIEQVQKALPDWLTLTVSSADDEDNFHIKLNNIFIPLDFSEPEKKINGLIDTLQTYVRCADGDTLFYPIQAFTPNDYFRLDAIVLHEILWNLGSAPVAIFISKDDWYVHVYEHGIFYPLPHVSPAEFIDYINDIHREKYRAFLSTLFGSVQPQ